jgi:hypothetical protein
MDVASAKIRVLEKYGYSPVGYFVLPEHCWLDQYYRPMQASFEDFLNRNGNSWKKHAQSWPRSKGKSLRDVQGLHHLRGVCRDGVKGEQGHATDARTSHG